MARRTLEGTCADQGITRGSLAARLKKLHDKGTIDQTLTEWADALRVIGNVGAHYSETTVSRQDADDALAFAEALLDHIYVLRQRFDEFKTRISQSNA